MSLEGGRKSGGKPIRSIQSAPAPLLGYSGHGLHYSKGETNL